MPQTTRLFGLLLLVAATTAAARQPFADATATHHPLRARDFDLQHTRAEISFDLELGRVHGVARQTLAPLRAGLTRVVLDQIELTIEEVTDGDGSPLSHRAEEGRLVIELGRAHPVGEPFDVTIRYHGQPRAGMFFVAPDDGYPDKPRQVWTQGETVHTQRWLPTWDHPNDRTTSEMLVTVPSTWSAISNGVLVAESEDAEAGTRTFHWHQQQPHVTYLISIAAGELEVERETASNGVELSYWVPTGRSGDIERSFGKTAAMMEFFTSWLDRPYPWDKYAQVVVNDFIFGGMENTSATTLTSRTLHAADDHLDYPSDGLVAHEAAHQWFGDEVTCKTWSHIWLNESFATYFEALWAEHDLGRDEMDYNLYRKAEAYFEQDADDYRRPIVQETYTSPIDLFDRHAYQKGALVLHMLRDVLGDDSFQRGIRSYLDGHAGGVAETDQLRIAVEEVTGVELGWFFAQWTRGAGYPELAWDWSWEPASRMVAMRLRQTQERRDGTARFRAPVRVRVWTPSGHRDHRVDVRLADQLIYLPADAEPLAVSLNPGNDLLCKLDPKGHPVEQLALPLTRAERPIDRIVAAHLVGRSGARAAVVHLARALAEDPFWGVRAEAAEALGATGAAAAYEALAVGLDDSDSRVRAAVCEALGKLKDRRARGRLIDVLSDDPSDRARAAAAEALGKVGGDRVFSALRKALRQESHNDVVRKGAWKGLGVLGDEAAIPLAHEWSRYGKPPAARVAAIEALGKLAPSAAKTRQRLEELASADPYIWARGQAIESLGEVAADESLPLLERATRPGVEVDGRIRRKARLAAAKVRAGKTAAVEERLGKLDQGQQRLRRGLERLEAAETSDE